MCACSLPLYPIEGRAVSGEDYPLKPHVFLFLLLRSRIAWRYYFVKFLFEESLCGFYKNGLQYRLFVEFAEHDGEHLLNFYY